MDATLAQLPSFDLTRAPRSLSITTHPQSFWRDAKWAPDGASILAQGEDRTLSIYGLPPDLLDEGRAPGPLSLYRSIASPSSLLCAEWFPSASSAASETYCFVRSVRDAPIHLLDGTSGKVRASYPIIDNTERFIGPHSMAFSPDGSVLYCGHDNAIEIVDIGQPQQPGTRLATCPTRRSKDGQRGLITALAVNAHDPSQLAAGSYSSTVGLYDLDSEHLMQVFAVPGGGVTQVAFHPTSPNTLVVASRCSEHIQLYDIRNTSEAYGSLDRGLSRTNQRMHFSLEINGRYLAAGAEDGTVRIFSFETDAAEPALTFAAGKGAVASAALHPYLPLLLTASGSRTFGGTEADSASSASEEEEPTFTPGQLAIWDLR